MLRYYAGSALAQAFSATPTTRRSYRKLGNSFETWRRQREGLPERYVQRARRLIDCTQRYTSLGEGSTVLELGTGYVHWESLVLSLACGTKPVLYDVVDNRLLPVFKLYAAGLAPQFEQIGLPPERARAARDILDTIQQASSFDEIYPKLSWTYIVDETGKMDQLAANSFDFVVSSDVLEHVDRSILEVFLDKMFALMRPGSYTYHSIGLSDHLANFDPKAPAKYYYRFAGPTWDRWFNSQVQYINRVQPPEWLSMFERAGFELVSEETNTEPHGVKKVHPSYAYLTQTQMDAKTLILLLRKPE